MSRHAAARSLDERRDELLTRSAELRVEMGEQLRVWQRPADAVDQVRGAWHWARTHPQWPLGALFLVAWVRPRRAMRWLGRGLWAWRLWQSAKPWIERAMSVSGADMRAP